MKAIVVTHSHNDRNHRLDVARGRGIPIWGLPQTSTLLTQGGRASLDHPTVGGGLNALGVPAQLLFRGHGHAPDNAVVWLEDHKVLFGGCFVKSADSTTLGYTADADLDSWYDAVRKLSMRLPDIAVVMPGHGSPGRRSCSLTPRVCSFRQSVRPGTLTPEV